MGLRGTQLTGSINYTLVNSRERRGDPKHNRGATARGREEGYSRSPTPHLEEEEDDFIQKYQKQH
jgi:hypothetical protein